jgi:hypothetical protein
MSVTNDRLPVSGSSRDGFLEVLRARVEEVFQNYANLQKAWAADPSLDGDLEFRQRLSDAFEAFVNSWAEWCHG